VLVIS